MITTVLRIGLFSILKFYMPSCSKLIEIYYLINALVPFAHKIPCKKVPRTIRGRVNININL